MCKTNQQISQRVFPWDCPITKTTFAFLVVVISMCNIDQVTDLNCMVVHDYCTRVLVRGNGLWKFL